MVHPVFVCMTKLEDNLSLRGICKLRVIEVASVKRSGRCDREATSHRVILEVEHCRASRGILIHQLLDHEEHGRLPAWGHVHLNQGEALHKGIDGFDGDLFAFVENNVHTLEQCDEIFAFDLPGQRLFK